MRPFVPFGVSPSTWARGSRWALRSSRASPSITLAGRRAGTVSPPMTSRERRSLQTGPTPPGAFRATRNVYRSRVCAEVRLNALEGGRSAKFGRREVVHPAWTLCGCNFDCCEQRNCAAPVRTYKCLNVFCHSEPEYGHTECCKNGHFNTWRIRTQRKTVSISGHVLTTR